MLVSRRTAGARRRGARSPRRALYRDDGAWDGTRKSMLVSYRATSRIETELVSKRQP